MLLCMAVVMAMQASAQVKVTPCAPPSNGPAKASPDHAADVLIDEDFSLFTEGSEENPTEVLLASGFNGGTTEIDPALTHGLQWEGQEVYSAGGRAFVYNIDPQSPSWIRLPLGDYSGRITVSFKIKAVESVIPDVGTLTGSSVTFGPGSISKGYVDTDIDPDDKNMGFYDLRLYPKQGWCEVSATYNNYSADADGYIRIGCSGSILLDDVKVTAEYPFIAKPVIMPVSNPTETSVEINWQPVKKSFDYGVYLYELQGYNTDGTPKLRQILEPEIQEMIDQGIMDIEELPEQFRTYGLTYDTHFTLSDLDPEKEYFYSVRSHYVYTWSEEELHHALFIAPVKVENASSIKTDGYTANWARVPRATRYNVSNYGVVTLESDDSFFPIIEEDFEGLVDLSDATDWKNPEPFVSSNDMCFDDFTQLPGWGGIENQICQGMLGMNFWGGEVRTPKLWIAGDDDIILDMHVYSESENYPLYLGFAGSVYTLTIPSGDYQLEMSLPTNGKLSSTLRIQNEMMCPVMIDRIAVYQELKAGDKIYSWLSEKGTEADVLSASFDGLDDSYSKYAYGVEAFQDYASDEIAYSESPKFVIVDLAAGTSEMDDTNGLTLIETPAAFEIARYSLDGRLLSVPTPGINIIRYTDGSVRKVLVK